MCPAENLCCTTYCTIDAGQQLAIELHHGIYSSFHLLLSHGLQLSCRKKKLSVSHSVCLLSSHSDCYKFNVNRRLHLRAKNDVQKGESVYVRHSGEKMWNKKATGRIIKKHAMYLGKDSRRKRGKYE